MASEQEFADMCDAIWYLMACPCQSCSAALDTFEWERLKERDMVAWSRLVAEKAIEQGWTCSTTGIGMVCPNCRLNKHESA
jgi:hypothetical protein